MALLLIGCGSRDDSVQHTVVLTGIPGRFVVEDLYGNAPLTRPEHEITYYYQNRRLLIFRGWNNTPPKLSLLTPSTVLVSYCGGSIETTESSFFAHIKSDADNLNLIRLQIVISPGLVAGGKQICEHSTLE